MWSKKDLDENQTYIMNSSADKVQVMQNNGIVNADYTDLLEDSSAEISTPFNIYFTPASALLMSNSSPKFISAVKLDSTSTFYITDLNMDAGEWDSFSVGEKVDLDNDGEDELIINGPYGGIYLDARNNKVYEFAIGDGNAIVFIIIAVVHTHISTIFPLNFFLPLLNSV